MLENTPLKLVSLGLADRKVLVLSAATNEALYLSGRNLATVDVMPFAQASAYDVLWADAVVVEEGALTGETRELGAEELPALPEREKRVVEARAQKAAKKGTKGEAPKAAKPAKAAKKKTPKAAKKTSAKAAKKSTGKAAKKAAPKKKKGNK